MTPLSDAAFSAVPPEHWAAGGLALGDGVAQALLYGRWPEEEPEPTPAMLRAAATRASMLDIRARRRAGQTWEVIAVALGYAHGRGREVMALYNRWCDRNGEER